MNAAGSTWADRRLDDLITRIVHHHGLVLVSACVGSGTADLSRLLRDRVGFRAIIEGADPFLDPDLPGDAIVLGRNRFISASGAFGPALRLSESDLWFDVEEIERALQVTRLSRTDRENAAATIHRGTDGWPLAVTTVVDLVANDPDRIADLDRAAQRGPHFTLLFEAMFAHLSTEVRVGLGRVATFPILLADFFGAEHGLPDWQQARSLGLPLAPRPDGTLFIPGPARHFLASTERPDNDLALSWGRLLANDVGLADALRALLAAGAPSAAASLMEEADEQLQDEESHRELLPILGSIAATVDVGPVYQLRYAGALARARRKTEARETLARCEESALREGHKVTLLRARLHKAIDGIRLGDTRLTQERLDEFLRVQADHGTPLSAAELKELRFRAAATERDPVALNAAVNLGREAAADFAELGLRSRAARVLRAVAVGPIVTLGRYQRMPDIDDQAREHAGGRVLEPDSLALRCYAGALAGDLRVHQNTLNSLEELSEGRDGGWHEVYHWVSKLIAAGLAGNRAGVTYSFQRYREELGEVAFGQDEIQFEAMACIAFSLTGDEVRARRILDQLRTQQQIDPWAVAEAEITFEARIGDPFKVPDLVGQLNRQHDLPAERTWRIDLEALVALARAGDEVEPATRNDVMERAALAGLPKLAGQLSRPLQDIAPPSFTGSQKAVPSESHAIRVLGGFEVLVGGRPITVPTGKPSELVKLVAIRGGAVRVDAVVDALWPGSDLETGRKRMKNVLNRARTSVGDLLTRRGDLLTLDPTVTVDLVTFRRLVAAAEATLRSSSTFVDLSVQALELSRRGLLPDDPYLAWLDEERWSLEAISLRLLEQVVANKPDDLDANWLVDTALNCSPHDENLLVEIARLASARNDDQVTSRALDEAQALARRLDVSFAMPEDLAPAARRHSSHRYRQPQWD